MDSVFFPICLCMLFLWFLMVKLPHIEAENYRRNHNIDYGKINHDRTVNNLPDWMIDYNTKIGIYNKVEKKKDNTKVD